MDTIWFIDPGYGKNLLPRTGIQSVESINYNPYGGVAILGKGVTVFYDSPYAPVTKTSFPSISTAVGTTASGAWRISISFLVYCKDMANGGSFSIGYAKTTGATEPNFCGITISNGSYTRHFAHTPPSSTELTGTLSGGAHSISMSICASKWHKGSNINTNHKYTYFMSIDGKAVSFSASKNVISGETVTDFWYYPRVFGMWFPPEGEGKFYVSNIICCHSSKTTDDGTEITAGTPIPVGTKLIPLPLSEPETTFIPDATGNSEYIGTSKGQTLLQTIDTSSLIETYGEQTPVDTVVVYGNPGYQNVSPGTIFGVLDTKKKQGNSSTLPTTTDSNYGIDLETPTTLSDLHGKQIGWEIG